MTLGHIRAFVVCIDERQPLLVFLWKKRIMLEHNQFSPAIGVLSDCFPMFGYARLPYFVLSSTIGVASLLIAGAHLSETWRNLKKAGETWRKQEKAGETWRNLEKPGENQSKT